MNFDWSKPMIIDWSGRHGPLISEEDIKNSVIKRILCNQYNAPFCERELVKASPWWNPRDPFEKKYTPVYKPVRFIPGLRHHPLYPKLSTLTRMQHHHGLKVLAAKYDVQPRNYPKPTTTDYEVFEEMLELYEKEQKEYIIWAKQCWITGDCIRVLRPKPAIEQVYEAEFYMKACEVQSLPQNYALAAQIPLETKNQAFEMQHKQDLINVNINDLPRVDYPEEMERDFSILKSYSLPEPCSKHPCKFVLPNEDSVSVLPLTDIHRKLAQYAVENGASFIASENALQCLLETDKNWKIPVSIVEVICPEFGDMKEVVVLGNEFSVRKECAPQRTYKAYKHMLQQRFVPSTGQYKLKTPTKQTLKPNTTTSATVTNEPNALRSKRFTSLDDDLNVSSDENDRLQIDDHLPRSKPKRNDCTLKPDGESDNDCELSSDPDQLMIDCSAGDSNDIRDSYEPNKSNVIKANLSYSNNELDQLMVDDVCESNAETCYDQDSYKANYNYTAKAKSNFGNNKLRNEPNEFMIDNICESNAEPSYDQNSYKLNDSDTAKANSNFSNNKLCNEPDELMIDHIYKSAPEPCHNRGSYDPNYSNVAEDEPSYCNDKRSSNLDQLMVDNVCETNLEPCSHRDTTIATNTELWYNLGAYEPDYNYDTIEKPSYSQNQPICDPEQLVISNNVKTTPSSITHKDSESNNINVTENKPSVSYEEPSCRPEQLMINENTNTKHCFNQNFNETNCNTDNDAKTSSLIKISSIKPTTYQHISEDNSQNIHKDLVKPFIAKNVNICETQNVTLLTSEASPAEDLWTRIQGSTTEKITKGIPVKPCMVDIEQLNTEVYLRKPSVTSVNEPTQKVNDGFKHTLEPRKHYISENKGNNHEVLESSTDETVTRQLSPIKPCIKKPNPVSPPKSARKISFSDPLKDPCQNYLEDKVILPNSTGNTTKGITVEPCLLNTKQLNIEAYSGKQIVSRVNEPIQKFNDVLKSTLESRKQNISETTNDIASQENTIENKTNSHEVAESCTDEIITKQLSPIKPCIKKPNSDSPPKSARKLSFSDPVKDACQNYFQDNVIEPNTTGNTSNGIPVEPCSEYTKQLNIKVYSRKRSARSVDEPTQKGNDSLKSTLEPGKQKNCEITNDIASQKNTCENKTNIHEVVESSTDETVTKQLSPIKPCIKKPNSDSPPKSARKLSFSDPVEDARENNFRDRHMSSTVNNNRSTELLKRLRDQIYQEHDYCNIQTESPSSIDAGIPSKTPDDGSDCSYLSSDSNKSSPDKLTIDVLIKKPNDNHKDPPVRKLSLNEIVPKSIKNKTSDIHNLTEWKPSFKNLESCKTTSVKTNVGKISLRELFGDESDSDDEPICKYLNKVCEESSSNNSSSSQKFVGATYKSEINKKFGSSKDIICETMHIQTEDRCNITKSPLKPCLRQPSFSDSSSRNSKRKLSFSDPLTSDPEFMISESDEAIAGFENGIAVLCSDLRKNTNKQKDSVTCSYSLRSKNKPKAKPLKSAKKTTKPSSGFIKIAPKTSRKTKTITRKSRGFSANLCSDTDSDYSQSSRNISITAKTRMNSMEKGNVSLRRSLRISSRISTEDSDDSLTLKEILSKVHVKNVSTKNNPQIPGEKYLRRSRRLSTRSKENVEPKINQTSRDKFSSNSLSKITKKGQNRRTSLPANMFSNTNKLNQVIRSKSVTNINEIAKIKKLQKVPLSKSLSNSTTSINTKDTDLLSSKLSERTNRYFLRSLSSICSETDQSENEISERTKRYIRRSRSSACSEAEKSDSDLKKRTKKYAKKSNISPKTCGSLNNTEKLSGRTKRYIIRSKSSAYSSCEESDQSMPIRRKKTKKQRKVINTEIDDTTNQMGPTIGTCEINQSIPIQLKTEAMDITENEVGSTNHNQNITEEHEIETEELNMVLYEETKEDIQEAIKDLQLGESNKINSCEAILVAKDKLLNDQNNENQIEEVNIFHFTALTEMDVSEASDTENEINTHRSTVNNSHTLSKKPFNETRKIILERELDNFQEKHRTQDLFFDSQHKLSDANTLRIDNRINETDHIVSNKMNLTVIDQFQNENSKLNGTGPQITEPQLDFTESNGHRKLSMSETSDDYDSDYYFRSNETEELNLLHFNAINETDSEGESETEDLTTAVEQLDCTESNGQRRHSFAETSDDYDSDYYFDSNETEELSLFHFNARYETDSEDESETDNSQTEVLSPVVEREENSVETIEEIPQINYYGTNDNVESEKSKEEVNINIPNKETKVNTAGKYAPYSAYCSKLVYPNGALDTTTLSVEDINEVIGVHSCTCKGTLFEIPPSRSFKRWQVRNKTSNSAFNMIIHFSHKARKGKKEAILEPIVEYQPELGGSKQTEGRIRALALSLILRESAQLINVRVDHENGNVIAVDKVNLDEFSARHGDRRGDLAGTLHTAMEQLRNLMPGQYVLAHDISHGANAMLYSAKGGHSAVSLTLRADNINMPDAEDALFAKIYPELAPVLLPYHKHRSTLPLAFTPYKNQVREDKHMVATLAKAKLPPQALQSDGATNADGTQWPKKKKKNKKSRLHTD